jgi:hypothetical protein
LTFRCQREHEKEGEASMLTPVAEGRHHIRLRAIDGERWLDCRSTPACVLLARRPAVVVHTFMSADWVLSVSEPAEG